MADLDVRTGDALCRALNRVLSLELGTQVKCRDISGRSERWDIEALDATESVIRRVSYTQAVPERMAMAGAELRDVRTVVEDELATLGVNGIGLSLHGRSLPTSRRDRQRLARDLVSRVRRHVATGALIIADPMAEIIAGRHPYADPIAKAFADVEVHRRSAGTRARVMMSGDDRLGYRVPELYEEILPRVAAKAVRHKELTVSLTLVVEPVLSSTSRSAITEAIGHLRPEHRGFLSVYVGWLHGGRFPLRRLY